MVDFRSKRLKRIKIQAFLTCFISLGTVFAAGSATFAWFSTNKTATAQYSNIVAKDSSYVKSVSYHQIKTDGVSTNTDGTTTTYVFEYSTTTDFNINQYSRLNDEKEHQLLVEITLNDDAGSFNLLANADSDILGGNNSWAGVDWSDPVKNPFPLSSIIAFYYTDSATVVENSSITITRSTSETSFITLNNESPTFTQSLTLTSGSTSKKIYVMLDYNLEAIDSIYSYNIGNEAFDSDDGLTFNCDFSLSVRAS